LTSLFYPDFAPFSQKMRFIPILLSGGAEDEHKPVVTDQMGL